MFTLEVNIRGFLGASFYLQKKAVRCTCLVTTAFLSPPHAEKRQPNSFSIKCPKIPKMPTIHLMQSMPHVSASLYALMSLNYQLSL